MNLIFFLPKFYEIPNANRALVFLYSPRNSIPFYTLSFSNYFILLIAEACRLLMLKDAATVLLR